MSFAGYVPVADGLRLFVHDSGGAGTPALWLHGFTGSGERGRVLRGALGPGARVIAPDLPGHGASDVPEPGPAWEMAGHMRALAAVLDARAVPRAHLVGYSMGARVALAFAVAHPDRVARLVLIGGRAGLASSEERRRRVAADEDLADRIEHLGVPWFVDYWMAQPLFASQARLGKEALAAARRRRLRNRPEGLARSLRGIGAGAQPPLFDALPALARPVLLVTGAEDERFGAVARDLRARLPDARHRVLAEAGHAAHLENAPAFGEVLRSFLDPRDASRSAPNQGVPVHAR